MSPLFYFYRIFDKFYIIKTFLINNYIDCKLLIEIKFKEFKVNILYRISIDIKISIKVLYQYKLTKY